MIYYSKRYFCVCQHGFLNFQWIGSSQYAGHFFYLYNFRFRVFFQFISHCASLKTLVFYFSFHFYFSSVYNFLFYFCPPFSSLVPFPSLLPLSLGGTGVQTRAPEGGKEGREGGSDGRRRMLDKCLYPRHSSRSLTLGVSLQNDNKLKARHTDREGARAAGWACGRAFPFGKGVLM